MNNDKWNDVYAQGLRDTFVVNERMSRRDFLVFQTMIFLVSMVVAIAPLFLTLHTIIIIVINLFMLFQMVSGFTSMCRRLFDMGKSRWWLLIMLLPLIGPLILLIWISLAESEPDG